MARLPRNVKILGAASLLNDIASEMIFPLLPAYLLGVLHGNRFYLGLIEGLSDTVASVLKLWSGGWSDRAGRRKGFVMVGYALTVLVRPLIAIITSPWQLLAVRVSDRIGKGIRTSPRDALIADSTEPSIRGRAFGFHQAMDHFGAAIGPLLAAGFLWMWPDRLQELFLSTIVPGLAVVLLLAFVLKETAPTTPPKEKVRLTLAPFGRNFRLYLLALVVFTLGNSSDAFLLVRAGELGVEPATLPLLWCVFHIVKSTGNYLLGGAVDRFGPRPFLFAGWMLYAAIYLAFGLATSAWEVWLFFLVYALFYGLTEPAEKTLVVLLAGPERKGLAYGWFNFALGLGNLPASLIFGALYETLGALAAFAWSASMAILGMMILALIRVDRSRARQ